MNKQDNEKEKKEYYSFTDVNMTIEELNELVNAIHNGNATSEQLETLFNQSGNVELIKKEQG